MTAPSLKNLQVAKPCPAKWSDMAGSDRVRFCDLCRRNVYNFSALSEADAVELLRSTESVCGLLFRRPDGTVLTADCPVGIRAAATRRMRLLMATAAGLLLTMGGRFLTPAFKERCHDATKLPVTAESGPGLSQDDAEVRRLLGSLGYIN